MTDHPLTDEICRGLVPFYCGHLNEHDFTKLRIRLAPKTHLNEHDFIEMRAAADWQLKKVIEWMKDNLLNPQGNRRQLYVYDNDLKTYKEFDYELIDRLTQAMRPTTQEDNND